MTACRSDAPDTRTRVLDAINRIDAAEWDRLAGCDSPFLRHAFLSALEEHGCAREFGWYPQHIVLQGRDGALRAAMPLYAKTNSYGEFVFDGNLATAYMQTGKEYYPKLVSAVPYTPISGRRLLGADPEKRTLIRSALSHAGRRFSGVNWLFCVDADVDALKDHRVCLRNDCQFHWHNPGYGDFDDFLGALRSKKRKMIKRERRIVRDSSLRCVRLSGHDVPEPMWADIHRLYAGIYDEKFGVPTLSRAFFRSVGRALGEDFMVFMAMDGARPVACAIAFRDSSGLYGRHWGCEARYHSLHFELCYYAGIEYCIKHGLRRFEPGAQGEHKVARGFLPALTQSAHWLGDAGFAAALEDYCDRERALIREYADSLRAEHNPYRKDGAPQQ